MFWLIQVVGAKNLDFSLLLSPLNLSAEPLILKHQHWKLSQHKTSSVLRGKLYLIQYLRFGEKNRALFLKFEMEMLVVGSRLIGLEMLSSHELR